MSGVLGSWDSVPGETHALYTPGSGVVSAVTVRACNRSAGYRLVSFALAAGQPTDADWIEWYVSVAAGEVLEDSALVLTTGQSVWVRADLYDVSFVCWGVEEAL